jgi:hypothetical protein
MDADEKTIDLLSSVIGLEIDPAYKTSVAQQFSRLMAQAQLILDFPLADEVEPAGIFRP